MNKDQIEDILRMFENDNDVEIVKTKEQHRYKKVTGKYETVYEYTIHISIREEDE